MPTQITPFKYGILVCFKVKISIFCQWNPSMEKFIKQYIFLGNRIFQFENFLRTRKRVFVDNNVASPDDEEAIVGMYVTIHIKDVPRHLFNTWKEKNDKLTSVQQVSCFYCLKNCRYLVRA